MSVRSRQPLQFLVPEVHPINWALWVTVSFVARVHVRVVHRACTTWPRGRMEVIDLAAWFTVDAGQAFRSRVVKSWEEWTGSVSWQRWRTWYRGAWLTFETKARQEAARQFERLLLLRELQSRLQGEGRVLLVTSAWFRDLAGAGRDPALFRYETSQGLSRLNAATDRLWLGALSLAFGLRTAAWLARGLVLRSRRIPIGLATGCLPIWYDCDNSNELTLDRARRTFTWLIDQQSLRTDDVLFLLPSRIARGQAQQLRRESHNAYPLPELYRFVPARELVRALWELGRRMGAMAFRWPARHETLVMGAYLAKVSELAPVVERWRPGVYVESMSALGQENPALEYLKRRGVTPVMYCMGGGYPFGHEPASASDFRSVLFAHIVASVVVVWHAHYKGFLEGHPQDGTRVLVIGPLMPGDESVMSQSPKASGGVTIVAFDVGTIRRDELLQNLSFIELLTFPDPYTEGYHVQFLEDMHRLLESNPRVRLIYKPKRNPTRERFLYTNRVRDLLCRIEAHPRGCVLEEAVNPWWPLAVADVCIVLPFSSPGMAALHYGRPVIYHDPAETVRTSPCPGLVGLVTSGFESLSHRVHELTESPSGRPGEVGIPPFLGTEAGQNSSDHFRALLWSVVGAAAPGRNGRDFAGSPRPCCEERERATTLAPHA